MPTAEAREARLQIVLPRRNWWEAFLLAFSVNSGYSSLAHPQTITPTWERLLPRELHQYWCWALIIGGLVALIAVLARPGLTSMLVERVGLLFMGGACYAYVAGLVMFVGFRSEGAITREAIVAIFAFLVTNRLLAIAALLRYARGLPPRRLWGWWR